MLSRTAPLFAVLALLPACHVTRPDHTDPKGVPPPARDELTWESFFKEPWRDPLHDKYEELFREPFPAENAKHFSVERPFSDVKKYELAFDAVAIPGAKKEMSAAGERAVSMLLPDSAGKTVEVKADEKNIRLSVARSLPTRRYRAYRPEELVVPTPAGADPRTARVVRDGDWVRIKFNGVSTGPVAGADSGRPHGK